MTKMPHSLVKKKSKCRRPLTAGHVPHRGKSGHSQTCFLWQEVYRVRLQPYTQANPLYAQRGRGTQQGMAGIQIALT